ncbi:OB-fold domain-containing protein [Nocardia niigatensis]|uniref:OB-fold domain-containing protein n=1 Tax=Nocardia niigatensis TaxID=209249 RepID=UPI000313BE1F|nr:OB-fold domain-containing protein [Nocardia niigatensis]
MTQYGITRYGTYLPSHRVSLADIGATLNTNAGKGVRVAAAFDEDSTTMGVAAAMTALADLEWDAVPASMSAGLHFATTTPAYADKTNATAIHAALGLPAALFAADLAGAARNGIAALRAASGCSGLAVLADMRVGRPGSADERGGGDGAAAFLFGDEPIAEVIAQASVTAEFLDRWRDPRSATGEQWEERFGISRYQLLLERAAAAALDRAALSEADHVVLVSPNTSFAKRSATSVAGKLSTRNSPIGHAGAADVGLALASVLDQAEPGETILVLSAADGCDALVLRVTDRITEARQPVPVAEQLAAGKNVPYTTYLNWRGLLDREPPGRPEPDRAAAPPSARTAAWKFSFTGTACAGCGLVHLPPARVCKRCGAIDAMTPISVARSEGTVTSFTVDRQSFSPAPPVVGAVVDFDGGGRYTLEVADADVDRLAVGSRVRTTFRRLNSAGGIHNYFWKAQQL